MPDALPNSIADYLRRVVVRAQRLQMLSAALWTVAAFAAWGLAACAIDRYAHLTFATRIGMLAGGSAIAVGILFWPMRRWGRPIDWVAVAAAVEAHRPGFGQQLVTVTSRLLGPGEHRGSEAMLVQLLAEVERRIAQDRSPVIGSAMGRLGWPLIACAALIAVAAGMLHVPGMELPQLAARFAMPWRPEPAVTTTRLTVHPDGDSDISAAQPAELRIVVNADRLGDGVVSLFTQPADGSATAGWSRLTMDQLSPGRFEYVFAGIDRDLRYYIAGGDAVSRVYSVRLLRPPAVSAFRIRYRYPFYVRQSAATVVNTDGQIEAPVGTQADVTITATEPLHSATLRIGSRQLAMTSTPDPQTFAATIPIETDQSYSLEMISTRQVAGTGPNGPGAMRIHALPNRPPMLRLTDASGEPGAMLSVDPRQVLPVAFEAEDDFGIAGLSLRWQISAGKRGESAVSIPDGVRHIEDAVDFDLASLPLRVGDVLTVWLEVRNTAGRKATSQPIEALMAARPIDAEMRQRLAAIDAAAEFAGRLAGHLSAATAQLSGAPPDSIPGPQYEALSMALSSATEDAGLLRQSLLRAIAHGAPRQSAIALAGWVDAATVQSYWADRLFQQLGDRATLDAPARAKLTDLAASAGTMRDQLLAVDQGLWAEAALAELENLKNAHQAGGLSARVQQDAADDAKSAGCAGCADPSALSAKVAAAAAMMASQAPVDFSAAAQQWAQELCADPHTPPSLWQRLRSAAEAEALRQRGDLPAARDLELSSRAADSLQSMASEHGLTPWINGESKSFVAAMSSLVQEWQTNDAANPPSPEPPAIRQAAIDARKQMARWARMTEAKTSRVASGSHPGGSPHAAARSAESAALAAAAQSAGHYASATTRPAASAIAGSPFSTGPASAARMRSGGTIGQKLETAQQIDAIDQRQQDLLQQTSVAAPAEAPTLAQRQQQVADSIATVAAGHEPAAIGDEAGAANWRQREAATLAAIGQQLAEMPQQLATAQEAMSDAITASAHADAAMADVARLARGSKNATSAELVRAAKRAAQQSSADASDAARRLGQLTQPVSPATSRQMAQALAPFAPEASAAEAVISDQLLAALTEFQRAMRGRDVNGGVGAASSARDAIGVAEQALADAQNALAERDPLVTASSSARAAVASLRRSPPDFSTAVRHQTQVTLSLSRAWDQSIHGAAAQRLAAVPGLQPLFAIGAGPAAEGVGDGGAPLAEQVAHGRQWGRFQGQGSDSSVGSAAGGNAAPPGFEDALRLYFEALGKAQKDGK
jgi:hypothetical protein